MNSSFAANLRCPDDGHLLGANDKGRVKFATCRHCNGLWFSREAIHSRFRAFDRTVDYVANLIAKIDELGAGHADEPLLRLSLRRKRRDK